MMTCKDISKLVSDSMDRKLPLRLRMELRVHLMMCSLCRIYRNKTVLLRQILHADPSEFPAQHSLPEGAALRIQQALDKLTS